MSGGMGGIPGTAYGGATDPSALQITDGFRLIPSVFVGERYDTNVLFAAKNSGAVKEDYVTTATPQLRGLYAGNLVTVNAAAAAFAEYYVKNTALSYVGTSAGAMIDASKLASRVREGTRLNAFDTYIYTPIPPAFLTGDVAGEGNNPYLRGFQVGRANTQSNIFGANLAVPISQVVDLTGGYTRGFIKFGSTDVQQPGALLNTNFQTYTAGLSMKMSRQDTISLNFVGSEYVSEGTFATWGSTVGWTRLFTPNVSLISNAGAQLVETRFTGTPSSTTIAPVGRLTLLWKDSTTTLTLAYNVGVTPAYQFQPQALLSNVASVSLTQQTAIPELLGIGSLSYGRGDQIGGTGSTAISYDSWGANGGFIYRVTPKTFLGLTYFYQNNDQSFGGQSFTINRQVVQFSLNQALY